MTGEFSSPATPRKPRKCRQCAVHGVDAGAGRGHSYSCPHALCDCQACLEVKRSRDQGRAYYVRSRLKVACRNAIISDTPADATPSGSAMGSADHSDDHCYARSGPTSSSPPPGPSHGPSCPAPGATSDLASAGEALIPPVLRDDNEVNEVEAMSGIGTSAGNDSAAVEAGVRCVPPPALPPPCLQILERSCKTCARHKAVPMHFIIGASGTRGTRGARSHKTLQLQCPFKDCDCSRCVAARNLKEKKRQFEAQFGRRSPALPMQKRRCPRPDSNEVLRRPAGVARRTTSTSSSTDSASSSADSEGASADGDIASSFHRNEARDEVGVAPAAPLASVIWQVPKASEDDGRGVLDVPDVSPVVPPDVPPDADGSSAAAVQARRFGVFDLLWGRDDIDDGVPLRCPDCPVSLASEPLQDHVDAVHMRLVPLQRLVRLFGMMRLGPRDQDARHARHEPMS